MSERALEKTRIKDDGTALSVELKDVKDVPTEAILDKGIVKAVTLRWWLTGADGSRDIFIPVFKLGSAVMMREDYPIPQQAGRKGKVVAVNFLGTEGSYRVQLDDNPADVRDYSEKNLRAVKKEVVLAMGTKEGGWVFDVGDKVIIDPTIVMPAYKDAIGVVHARKYEGVERKYGLCFESLPSSWVHEGSLLLCAKPEEKSLPQRALDVLKKMGQVESYVPGKMSTSFTIQEAKAATMPMMEKKVTYGVHVVFGRMLTAVATFKMPDGRILKMPEPKGPGWVDHGVCYINTYKPAKVEVIHNTGAPKEYRIFFDKNQHAYVNHEEGKCWLGDMHNVIDGPKANRVEVEPGTMKFPIVTEVRMFQWTAPVEEKKEWGDALPTLKEFLW